MEFLKIYKFMAILIINNFGKCLNIDLRFNKLVNLCSVILLTIKIF